MMTHQLTTATAKLDADHQEAINELTGHFQQAKDNLSHELRLARTDLSQYKTQVDEKTATLEEKIKSQREDFLRQFEMKVGRIFSRFYCFSASQSFI